MYKCIHGLIVGLVFYRLGFWGGNLFLIAPFSDRCLLGKIAAHSAYEMFSWYRYLIVSLVFSHLGFLEWESFAVCAFS